VSERLRNVFGRVKNGSRRLGNSSERVRNGFERVKGVSERARLTQNTPVCYRSTRQQQGQASPVSAISELANNRTILTYSYVKKPNLVPI
jgi:hypothetical protein